MPTIGYAVMCEQFHPTDLVRYSKLAEDSGFTALMVSDHFQPWVPQQGQSPFVWALLGALGHATNLRFGTGVTPPGYRYHPAIVAQAAERIDGRRARCEKGAREAGKDPSTMPRIIQLHVSWAESQDEALRNAMVEWPNGGLNFPKQDVRSPEDFAAMAKLVRPEHY